ncbi:MAG: glycosyltransferase family 39 protein [Candidatus Omnitrophica bacterium]|nr:glycosyltransferase family 39 protein [Candidatus Omnitrophota bacterium]MBU4488706.1 glycosyltransferase family 39 protein [Candidatus Omnitrophota bacterium]MCG2705735.1 glycosyltransferase family 39 protein [Candidatus Omnitrophota bacterium]
MLKKFSEKSIYIPLLLAIILIYSFGIRNIGFRQPHHATFDEILYLRLGEQLKEDPTDYIPEVDAQLKQQHRMPAYINRPIFKHPPLFPWLISLTYLAGEADIFGSMPAILAPLLSGILIIVFTFVLAAKLYDYRVGLLAAFFLSIDPIHWICSEKIWMETTLTLFMLLALLFFFCGIVQSDKLLLLSGIFAGLALLTKYTGLISLISIFIFAVLFDEKLIYRRNFWFIFIIAAVIFSPWILWNYKVYGSSFLRDMIFVHSEFYKFLNYKVLIASLSVIAAIILLLTTRLIGHRPGFKRAPFALWAVIITLFAAMALFCPSFRAAAENAFIYNRLPQTGYEIGMFAGEPWTFYFGRLLELSPLYLLSFISMVLFSLGGSREDLLLILSASLMMFFFVIWGNYQSRYLLPVIPIFLMLAGRLVIWVWDRSNTVCRVLFLAIIGYFIIKTANVDIHIALPNSVIYF